MAIIYEWLLAAVQAFDRRIGWHRFGLFLSLAVIVAAILVLYRMLHDIDPAEVVAALRGFSTRDLLIAAAFVAFGYVTLTFYDIFALHTVGRRDVPYRVAVMAGFTSYAVGHNVGASALTGGAVRYRIYSHHGLSAIEVAKVCFVAGFTFWLGNATMLGLGFAYTPEAASAIDQLPPWLNRTVGFAILVVLAIYVGWVWCAPRMIGRNNWELTLPSGPLTLLQIGIGVVDLSACAAAMYMLVPETPYIGFATVATIFVSATLLGFASHSPGGLGVFDAAMLIALWQYEKEALLAGLLLFRLLYYLCPFAIALVVLGLREVWLSVRRVRSKMADHAARPKPSGGRIAKNECDPA